jgi:hypothetical protein
VARSLVTVIVIVIIYLSNILYSYRIQTMVHSNNDHEMADGTAAVAGQRLANKRAMVFSAWSTMQQLNSHRERYFL